jgi:hypothetical protein
VLAKVRELGRIESEEYTAQGVEATLTIEKKYLHLIENSDGKIIRVE